MPKTLVVLVLIAVALAPFEPHVRDFLGITSALSVGFLPILSTLVALAIWKMANSSREFRMAVIASGAWLIGHFALMMVEQTWLEPRVAQIEASRFQWLIDVPERPRAFICSQAGLTCLPTDLVGKGASPVVSPEIIQGVVTQPLQLLSILISLAWGAGLMLVIFLHRRKRDD